MSGNVREWCWDAFSHASISYRRIRGGNWSDFDIFCTVAYRDFLNYPNEGYNFIGFRLARSSGN
jgi:formylglycine-generating enzyme required for sulfatase activity